MPVYTVGQFVRVKSGPNTDYPDSPRESSIGCKLVVSKYGAARDAVWVENENGAEDVVPLWCLEPWDDKHVWHGGKWIAITPEMGLPTVDDGSLDSKVGRLRDMVCGVNNCLDELRKAFAGQTKELEVSNKQRAGLDKLLLEEKSKRGDAEVELNKTNERCKTIQANLEKQLDVGVGLAAKIKQYDDLVKEKNDQIHSLTAAHNKAVADRQLYYSRATYFWSSTLALSAAFIVAMIHALVRQ